MYRVIYHPIVLIKSLLIVIRVIAETKVKSHLMTMLKKHVKQNNDKDVNLKLNPVRVTHAIIFKYCC